MFGRNANADTQTLLAAIGRSQATIEFDMSGTILAPNKLFLHALSYQLDEVKG